MNKIIAALVTAICAAIAALLKPIVVAWVAIVLVLGLVGKVTGWGTTEMHKRVFIKPPRHLTLYGEPMRQRDYWHTERGKTCIRAWAFVYGWWWTMLGGVVCWLLIVPGTLTWQQQGAVAVLWFMWASLIGATSPTTYRFTVKYLFPLVVARVRLADQVVPVDDETGDDATIIPDELRRKDHVAKD